MIALKRDFWVIFAHIIFKTILPFCLHMWNLRKKREDKVGSIIISVGEIKNKRKKREKWEYKVGSRILFKSSSTPIISSCLPLHLFFFNLVFLFVFLNNFISFPLLSLYQQHSNLPHPEKYPLQSCWTGKVPS